ncbi:MAG: DUF302 domain-containing protein [Phycisphaerae bacterium]|nr:DUF302 domain-containing protein [Phycisphaerae bacterium]
MLYIRESARSVQDTVARLQQSVEEHRFGVLGQIDMKAKMADKGVPFEHECVILEVCNPQQAKQLLERDLAVSTSLPCRISVYRKAGSVTVATVKPTKLLEMYDAAEDLKPVAEDVERTLLAIINAACEA